MTKSVQVGYLFMGFNCVWNWTPGYFLDLLVVLFNIGNRKGLHMHRRWEGKIIRTFFLSRFWLYVTLTSAWTLLNLNIALHRGYGEILLRLLWPWGTLRYICSIASLILRAGSPMSHVLERRRASRSSGRVCWRGGSRGGLITRLRALLF